MKEYPSNRIDLWADARERVGQGADIESILQCLSPSEALLWAMREHEKLSWAECAATLGVPATTLQRYWDQLIEKLRKEIEDVGG